MSGGMPSKRLCRPGLSCCGFIRSLETAAVAAAVVLLASSAPLAQALDTRPIVVVREDDCNRQWTIPYVGLDGFSGLQYGKIKRIPITWGIISDWATRQQSLSWAELRDYLDTAGGEAASHSRTHTAQTSVAAYVAEIASSKAEIEANLAPYACTTFYQPGVWGAVPDSADTLHAYMDTFSELNNPIGQAIQANYTQGMAFLAGGWLVGPPYYRYGFSPAYGIDAADKPSIPGLEARLDAVAATPGTICIISCHGIIEQGTPYNGYAVPANVMKALMDKLALLRDQGKIRLMGLHEAMHTPLPHDLNRVPDSGFEAITPAAMVPHGAWRLLGNSGLVPSGGIGDSRCAWVREGTGTWIESTLMLLGPGRYRMSWYQKRGEGVSPGLPVRPYVINTKGKSTYVVYSPRFTNSSPTEWEQKSVLLTVKNEVPLVRLYFHADGTYYIDNVALVPEPVDPAISASNVSISPSPGQCCVAWDTPSDASTTQIIVRYSSQTHPQKPTDGTELGRTQALPGMRQQVSAPLNWAANPYAYFSVFAMQADGSHSAPDIAMAAVEQTAPAPEVSVSPGPSGTTIEGSWTAGTPDQPIYQYQYALGSEPGSADLFPWTTTQATHVSIPVPANSPETVYLLVRAQNVYGYWSDTTATPVAVPHTPSAVMARPDGETVSVTGVITAIFADAFYLEQPDRGRGIRVIGPAPSPEGVLVWVTGILTTSAGERAIIPSQ